VQSVYAWLDVCYWNTTFTEDMECDVNELKQLFDVPYDSSGSMCEPGLKRQLFSSIGKILGSDYNAPMRIHFICRGNVYRSMMAEAYCNSLRLPGVQAVSSGTVAEANRTENEACLTQTADILTKHGLGDYVKHRGDQLTQERIDGSNVVVCMNRQIYDECQGVVRLPGHALIWDVGDWTNETVPPATLEAQTAHTERTLNHLKEKVDKLLVERK
jgi:protein-tyrosine-phosphatase